ncbi:hypothetical protein KKF91_05395, partial [Myxococcota bacterium]|nr:hypothetical protein [Myxococcota bacterium]
TFFALDLDIRRKALEEARGRPARIDDLRARVARAGLDLRAQALDLGLPLLLEDSGFKGRHLWGFLEQPLPAELVHKLGRRLLRTLRLDDPDLALEFFPKQARVEEDGLGNLIKLPLGIHRKTGRRAALLDAGGQPLNDPWPTLREAARLSRDQLLDALGRLREAPAHAEALAPPTQAPLEPASPRDAEALEALLAGCPVLAHLLDHALRTRRLSHDEQVVLTYTLGHLEAGVARLNEAFERCPEVPQRAQLRRPMRGHPISCARVRQRIPWITAQQACHCAFDPADGDYPNPLIHSQRAIARPAQPPDGRALSAALEALPDQTLVMPGGRWILEDGRPVWRVEAP